MRKLATALVCSFAFGAAAMAADAPTKVRQQLMKTVGDNVKIGGAMVKGEAEFDAAKAQEALNNIHQAVVDFGDLFPEGSETGDETEASPKIWSDRAGFDEKNVKFVADVKAAAESAPGDLDAFKAAFGQVTGNCKGCHENYRIKKD